MKRKAGWVIGGIGAIALCLGLVAWTTQDGNYPFLDGCSELTVSSGAKKGDYELHAYECPAARDAVMRSVESYASTHDQVAVMTDERRVYDGDTEIFIDVRILFKENPKGTVVTLWDYRSGWLATIRRAFWRR